MTSIRRALTLVLAGLLSAWLLPSPTSAATLAWCASKPTYIEAFHVETKWNKKVYKRSETARVEVTVTRPPHKDPATGSPFQPPISTPEADVTVTTALLTNTFPPPFDRDITDEDGKVYFKLSLKDVKPGKYDARSNAEKWTNEGGCPDIVEWGEKYEPKVITVK